MIGIGQLISCNGFTLTLPRCAFNPDELDGIGYRRKVISEPKIEFNLYGTSFVRGVGYRKRMQFEWSLLLNDAERDALEFILASQQQAIAERNESNLPLLNDTYLPFYEAQGTASRPVLSMLSASATAVKYYAQFRIVITTQPTFEWFFDNRWRVSFQATEVN